MSTLNDIKKLRKLYPNDMEFGSKIDIYLKANATCCDNLDNIVEFTDLNSGPYGYDVTGLKCRKCGSIIDLNIDR